MIFFIFFFFFFFAVEQTDFISEKSERLGNLYIRYHPKESPSINNNSVDSWFKAF